MGTLCSLFSGESPITNTPEKFAHLDTKQEGDRKRQLKNFCDSCEVKEIQQLEAWAEKGENRFSKFQAH
jgi:hypothetical protein